MENDSVCYRPVQAVSVTGVFPGFARPHFMPENLYGRGVGANTLYVQQVIDEQVVAFETVEEDALGRVIAIDRSATKAVRLGDSAVYVYAFGPTDAVAGTRRVVEEAITRRFDEIAPLIFAACTAAEFAKLKRLLPDLNRRAFGVLSRLDSASALQWRDSVVFSAGIRRELEEHDIPSDAVNIRTEDQGSRLAVTVSLAIDEHWPVQKQRIEARCKQLLRDSGLFGPDDLFTLDVHPLHEVHDRADPAELDYALRRAKAFLEEQVFLPALSSPHHSKRIHNVVRDTRHWISKFRKIGDLVRYMDRFQPDTEQSSFAFREIKQIRFEDVYAGFVNQFGRYRQFETRIVDFREGQTYTAFELSIFTRTYNNRGGGIRPVGKTGVHEAVVVNVTLSGGKYANEWLEFGTRLKCYLKAPRGRGESQYEELHNANQAIMKFPHVPVLVFVRNLGEADFTYYGIFRYAQISADDQGGKWFELARANANA